MAIRKVLSCLGYICKYVEVVITSATYSQDGSAKKVYTEREGRRYE